MTTNLHQLLTKYQPNHYVEGFGTVEGPLKQVADDIIKQSMQLIQDLVDHREPASNYVSELRSYWYSTPQNRFDEILANRAEVLAKAKLGNKANQWWITPCSDLDNRLPCELDMRVVYKYLINMD